MQLAREQMQAFSGGVNDSAAPSEYLPNELAGLVNGRISLLGNAVERRLGSQRTHATALNGGKPCWGAREFETTQGNLQLVVFVGDSMYTSIDDGLTWDLQASGLLEAYWSLRVIREGATNVLCCANGGTSYQWDGTTWSEIENIEHGVKHLEVFGDRLVGAGHSGVDVIASKVSDIETWAAPDGWTVRATTHDGDTGITGLYVLGRVLLVFKRESVGYIEGYGYQTLQVAAGAQGVSRSVGLLASRSLAAVGDQAVMWLSERGWEYYEVGGRITLVSRNQQAAVDAMNRQALRGSPGIPSALWWPARQEYWCAYPSGVSARNNRIFVYRPASERAPAASWLVSEVEPDPVTDGDTVTVDANGYLNHEDGDNTQANMAPSAAGYLEFDTVTGFVDVVDGYLSYLETLTGRTTLFNAVRGADEAAPCSAGVDGFVRYEEYHAERDDAASDGTGGFPINMTVIARPFLFGDQFRKKTAKRLRILSEQAEAATVTATVAADGVSGPARSLTFAAASEPGEERVRVGGKGRVLQATLETSDAVRITGIEMTAGLLRNTI